MQNIYTSIFHKKTTEPNFISALKSVHIKYRYR